MMSKFRKRRLPTLQKKERPGLDDNGVIEANDISPEHAVHLAKAWKHGTKYRWVIAVNTAAGLFLTTKAGEALRFATVVPQKDESSQKAASEILSLYGFDEASVSRMTSEEGEISLIKL